RTSVDGARLCAFLPDATQRRRVRRHEIRFAGDRHPHDVRPPDLRDAPQSVDARSLRRAGAIAGAGPWLWAWIRGENTRRTQPAARITRALPGGRQHTDARTL